MSLKSDVAAKMAFLRELIRRGYTDVRITRTPADISACMKGVNYLFEIKYTRAPTKYFGAATLTEWVAAVSNLDRFRFVVAYEVDGVWHFDEYTATEFMDYSYIPPFKIFFNVSIGEHTPSRSGRPSKKVMLSVDRLTKMQELYKAFSK
jgi:hypothetical protein